LNTFQQAILFILLILGSAILISSTVLMVRKQAFEDKLKHFSEEREASRRASALELQNSTPELDATLNEGDSQVQLKGTAEVHERSGESSTFRCDQIIWVDDDQITVGDVQARNHHHHRRVFPMAGVGARPDLNNHPRDVAPLPLYTDDFSVSGLKGIIRGTQKYFSSKGFISRNSQFYGLTSTEREKLGGVEYKAVSFLAIIVSLYFSMFLILGIVGMGAWLEANHPEVSEVNGLSPFWTGAFFAVSAFVNSGMSLLDKNMTALQLKYDSLSIPLFPMIMMLTSLPVPTHFSRWACSFLRVIPFTHASYASSFGLCE
jgi:hypothetical protein